MLPVVSWRVNGVEAIRGEPEERVPSGKGQTADVKSAAPAAYLKKRLQRTR